MRRKPLLFAALLPVICGVMPLRGAESILDSARSLPGRGANVRCGGTETCVVID